MHALLCNNCLWNNLNYPFGLMHQDTDYCQYLLIWTGWPTGTDPSAVRMTVSLGTTQKNVIQSCNVAGNWFGL